MYIYIYIHTYIYIYMYVHTYINIHTQTNPCSTHTLLLNLRVSNMTTFKPSTNGCDFHIYVHLTFTFTFTSSALPASQPES